MIKDYNKVTDWLEQVKSLKPVINIKLDKEVYDYDNYLLIQYYKVKKLNAAFAIKIDLKTNKICNLYIDYNYISLKKLRKQYKINDRSRSK